MTRVLKTRDERFVSAAYGLCRSSSTDDKPTRGGYPDAGKRLFMMRRRPSLCRNGFARCARNAGFNRHRVRGIDDRGILSVERRLIGACAHLATPDLYVTRPSLHKQHGNFRKFRCATSTITRALRDRRSTTGRHPRRPFRIVPNAAHPGVDGSLRSTATCNKAPVAEFVTSRSVDGRDN